MSITGGLISFGVRYVFEVSADQAVAVIEKRLTDHSQALPKALSKANDRAWDAVGLALAGDGLFSRILDVFRDGDIKGVRNQIKKFLDNTPSGLENTTAGIRTKATEEWTRLRRAGRFVAAPVSAAEVARRVATMVRHGDPARMTAAAHHAVKEAAEAFRDEAPNLADLLTAAPEGGTPLLAAAFSFFFRRELETEDELARGLSFDFLRQISEGQERGFALLDDRTSDILDQMDVLCDAMAREFAGVNEKLDDTTERLCRIEAKLHEPLKPGVSYATEAEREFLRRSRDDFRLNAGRVGADTWGRLADAMTAARMPGEAQEAHAVAADAARAEQNPEAEAANHFKAFFDGCDAGVWGAAFSSLRRAIDLAPARYQPFDPDQFVFDVERPLLGAGTFGTVFLCHALELFDADNTPLKVAIKSFRDDVVGADLARAFEEGGTLKGIEHPGVVKILARGYADRRGKARPFLVMEFFDGVTLDQHLAEHGPLSVADFVAVFRTVAEAVHAAHTKGKKAVYHRDLKPANIMVHRGADGAWAVRVIDFGLAVRVELAQTSLKVPAGERSTKDKAVTGTIKYAPPEQTGELPGVAVGPYSDVYAFGKSALECLFRTTAPKSWDWDKLPADLRGPLQELLERCTVDALGHRHKDFAPVLAALAELDPAERANREHVRQQEQELRRQAEAAGRLRAAEAERQADAERQQREQSAEQERAERLELWKRSGHPQAWVEEHLDGWDHTAWAALVEGLKSSPYWPLKADEIAAVVEALASDLRAERDRRRAAEEEQKCRAEEASRKAEEEAKARDPFRPGRARTAGETAALPLPGGLSMTFAWIPRGTFLMGGNGGSDNPQHWVAISNGFYAGIYPVTQAQWKAVTGTEPSYFKGDDRPVEQVSWSQSQEFCQKLAQFTGRPIRLPTEAEWEYACRAGSTSKYWSGNGIESLEKVGWSGETSGGDFWRTASWWTRFGFVGPPGAGETKPVGQLLANSWGLYDVHGNVREWCQDWYGTLTQLKQTDPIGQSEGTYRSARGGAWSQYAACCRSGYRGWSTPWDQCYTIGLRVCFHLDG